MHKLSHQMLTAKAILLPRSLCLFSDCQEYVQVYKAVALKCSEQVLEVMFIQRKMIQSLGLTLGF
jgi:hypothetical protein